MVTVKSWHQRGLRSLYCISFLLMKTQRGPMYPGAQDFVKREPVGPPLSGPGKTSHQNA